MPGVYDDHLVFEVMDSAPSSSSRQPKNDNNNSNHNHGTAAATTAPTSSAVSSAASSHNGGHGGNHGNGHGKHIGVRRGSASAGGSGSTAVGEPTVAYTYRMPLKMTVTGCPLVIEQNTLGMSYVRGSGDEAPSSDSQNHNHSNNNNHGDSTELGDDDANTVHTAGTAAGEVVQAQGQGHPHSSETMDSPLPLPPASKGQALLLMGKACLNSDPLERSFRVKNEGCKPGKIKWKIRSLYPEIKSTTGLKTDIVVGADGKVRSKIQFWTDVLRAAPFTIEPKAAIIPSYTSQTFRVVLTQTNVLGKIHALLTGKVEIEDDNVLKKRLAAGGQVNSR